jgi:hypothetical protein
MLPKVPKKYSNILSGLFLVFLPLGMYLAGSSTRHILLHPIGILLFMPAGLVIANRASPRKYLSTFALLVHLAFFAVWGVISVSILGTRTTQNSGGWLFTPILESLGMSWPNAYRLGNKISFWLFIFSMLLIVSAVIWAFDEKHHAKKSTHVQA